MTLYLLQLTGLFLVGFVTWFLALARTLALVQRRASLLCTLIFAEESTVLLTGIWLARHGSLSDVIACAVGGVVASIVILKIFKKRV